MKKFILFIIGALLLTSCEEKVQKDHIMTITYRMYYPGNVVEKTSTIDVTVNAKCEVYSYSGTNFLKVYMAGPPYYPKDQELVTSSTVPIELVSYEITKKQ